MLRALTRFLGTERAGARRQLRPRRLPLVDRRGRARERPRARLRRRATRSSSCRPSRSRSTGERRVAVNDVVATSSIVGRMVQLAWAIGGEELGSSPATASSARRPSGSTAYNLSNGGPVLVWGLDALAVTFVAPHTLHARPLVVPRGSDLVVWNRTPDVARDHARGRPSRRAISPPGGRARRARRRRSARCSRRCPR